jgi:hypothetical protein
VRADEKTAAPQTQVEDFAVQLDVEQAEQALSGT